MEVTGACGPHAHDVDLNYSPKLPHSITNSAVTDSAHRDLLIA